MTSALLGFLEKVNDGYELTLIGYPGDRRLFDDLDAVRFAASTRILHYTVRAVDPS